MKKKLMIFVSLIICSLALLLALPACDSTSSDGSDLQLDKKYIAQGQANTTSECYYLFYSNGTGIFRANYQTSYGLTSDYTITFKYTYADNDKTAVACFFDSVELGRKNVVTVSSNWSSLFTVSKNVLFTSAGGIFINEDYLKEIPNFNS